MTARLTLLALTLTILLILSQRLSFSLSLPLRSSRYPPPLPPSPFFSRSPLLFSSVHLVAEEWQF